ncbi:MAG: carbamoyl-phosphate synthase (glutamine-hydrolyzing) small subunit [Calditrichaeota bacterium]|nr:MAG: carbamoyl-phosphate synthase (glutamine-hydrolyzing) small subunit [Calditrichota bacterium]
MLAKLILEDGSVYEGEVYGAGRSVAGEVVFNTGMVGYPECFTDPSYTGQILVLTYPLIGNYGVPAYNGRDDLLNTAFESDRIHIAGLVVSEVSFHYSHRKDHSNLNNWLKANGVPAISGIDTRALTQKLRSKGAMLGKIVVENDKDVDFFDPNQENLVARVSPSEPVTYGDGEKTVLLVNCGCKYNIIRSLVRRNVKVVSVPWDWDFTGQSFAGLLVSNGPGDPRMCDVTVGRIRRVLEREIPTFGICLGNQLLALAAGASTYKLKFGHRSQNQPCVQVGSKRCFITSQNHGYAVDERSLPDDWEPWFFNANDGTNEGIRHKRKPFMGVQFHPEASPGPLDTAFLFDEFVSML